MKYTQKYVKVEVCSEPVKIAYTEWNGECDNVVLCLHGISRTGRDFDYIAEVLAKDYRVVCIDIVGRGKSDWLVRQDGYDDLEYAKIVEQFCQKVSINEKINIIGTSMGGIIGMYFTYRNPYKVRKLILNDIGSYVDNTTLERVAYYLKPKHFANEDELLSYMEKYLAPLSIADRKHWRHFVDHTVSKSIDGIYVYNYDPAIESVVVKKLRNNPGYCIDLWHTWEQITKPVLVIRGENSRVLPVKTLERMSGKSNVESITYAGVGHAPPLVEDRQISDIIHWISK